MSRYASGTSVPVDRSKAEIEKTLERYGADQFAYGSTSGSAMIGFRVHGRSVRMTLTLPKRDAPDFRRTDQGRARSESAGQVLYEQAVRQRWRALALVVKAKLEAVESGIATFDDEWLAYMVLPGGRTVSETIAPQLELAYAEGSPPKLLLDLEGRAP